MRVIVVVFVTVVVLNCDNLPSQESGGFHSLGNYNHLSWRRSRFGKARTCRQEIITSGMRKRYSKVAIIRRRVLLLDESTNILYIPWKSGRNGKKMIFKPAPLQPYSRITTTTPYNSYDNEEAKLIKQVLERQKVYDYEVRKTKTGIGSNYNELCLLILIMIYFALYAIKVS